MPPKLVNAVFLGTVGHLQPAIALAFTDAMSHAFIASIFICVIAVFFSLVRGGKRPVPAVSTNPPGQVVERPQAQESTRL